MTSGEFPHLEFRGEFLYLGEARRVAREVAFQAFALEPGSTTVIYNSFGGRLFDGHSWTASELRTLAEELVAAMRATEKQAAGAEPAWFVVRPGAQRRDKVIKLPLMYIGRESLTGVQVAVGSDRHEHIVGLNTEGGGPPYHQWEKLGDLAPGDEFWITILTKDVTGNLTFGLLRLQPAISCCSALPKWPRPVRRPSPRAGSSPRRPG